MKWRNKNGKIRSQNLPNVGSMADKSEADDVYDRSLKLLEPYKHDYNNRFKQVNDRLTILLEHQKKEVAEKQAFTEQQYKSEQEQLKRDKDGH
jgi:hypothetical protein